MVASLPAHHTQLTLIFYFPDQTNSKSHLNFCSYYNQTSLTLDELLETLHCNKDTNFDWTLNTFS